MKTETMKEKKPVAQCYNCVFASAAFKIGNATHHQCRHPKHEEGLMSGELSPWDTLQNWYSNCESHQPKKHESTTQQKID